MTARTKKAQDNGQEMTTEQAQAFLDAQNQLRLEQFKVKVDKLFADEGYALIAIPYLDDDGRIRAQARVVPRAV